MPENWTYGPPSRDIEVSEDAVTDAAIEQLQDDGECAACCWEMDEADGATRATEEQARTRHALSCQPLRTRVEAQLVQQAHERRREG